MSKQVISSASQTLVRVREQRHKSEAQILSALERFRATIPADKRPGIPSAAPHFTPPPVALPASR